MCEPGHARKAEKAAEAHLHRSTPPHPCRHPQARDLLCEAWAAGQRPARAEAAFLRGAAYLAAGNAKQALKDARFALVYGPQLDDLPPAAAAASAASPAAGSAGAGSSGAMVLSNGGGGGGGGMAADALPPGAGAGRTSAWPAALALQSAALEALADNVLAALSMARAAELQPESEEYAAALERLMRRIPEECAAALQVGGRGREAAGRRGLGACAQGKRWEPARRRQPEHKPLRPASAPLLAHLAPHRQANGAAGLEAQLAGEREAARPEYLRQRPKYYYYYEWMRKRISAQVGGPGLPLCPCGRAGVGGESAASSRTACSSPLLCTHS